MTSALGGGKCLHSLPGPSTLLSVIYHIHHQSSGHSGHTLWAGYENRGERKGNSAVGKIDDSSSTYSLRLRGLRKDSQVIPGRYEQSVVMFRTRDGQVGIATGLPAEGLGVRIPVRDKKIFLLSTLRPAVGRR